MNITPEEKKNTLKRALATLAAPMIVAASMLPVTAEAAAILFIDDDRGQTGNVAWTSTLTSLGHSVSYEAISASGQPVSNLAAFDAVIWSNGDQAYDNLTSANVSLLSSYLNGGGHLLYGGGHSLYQEYAATGFIDTYLGLTSYRYDMPMFQNCGATGSATGELGSFGLQCSSTGQWNNMLSGFNAAIPTARDLLVLDPVNISFSGGAPGTAVAAINETGVFSAMTIGFDLNHVVASDRAGVLSSALGVLLGEGNEVPEPGSLMLLAAGVGGLAMARRRKV